MIKKIIGRRRLNDLPVQAVDKSRTSHRYFQVTEFPRKFTAGKNVIKLRARGNVLVPDSVIHTEILDAQDNPIYHEILNYVEKDGTRVIVVYIYPDTPPGIATVYLAGRARRIRELRTGNIPFSSSPGDKNYKDNPNIKWIRTIPVQPSAENTTNLLFVSASGAGTGFPLVEISELTVPFFSTSHPSGSQFQTIKGSAGKTFTLRASPTTIVKVPDAAAIQGQGGPGESIPFIQSPFGKGVLKYGPFNRLPLNSLSPAIDKSPLQPFISQVTNSAALAKEVMKSQSPVELPGIELPQIVANGIFFEPDMVGAKITVQRPIIKLPIGGTQTVTSSYEATIVKLQSSTVADVTNTLNYTWTNPQNAAQSKIHGFNATTAWTASYSQKPNFVATQNSQSYANIVISNLNPAAGDIARVRVYQRALGATGNFKLVNETDVEQQDMLVDETSLTTTTGMGIFKDQSTINKYWSRAGGGAAGIPTAFHDHAHLMSAAKIVPHNSGYSTINDYHTFRIKDGYARRIYEGAPYYIEFDAKAFPNSKAVTANIRTPRIDIYMSGSAFNPTAPVGQQSPTFFINDRSLGKHIGTIEGGSGSRFDNIQAHFEPDRNGDGVPIFVIRAGEWQLSEIHMYPNRQEGFSPSMTRILVPISIEHMNSAQEFKIKYYNANSRTTKVETVVQGATFTGANLYIEGGSNLLTGSVFIGSSVGSGIEMAGVSSGFIRSIGYEGFDHATAGTGGPGFMIYSGSVLPGSGTTYNGVGLELVQDNDNYFRYRTNPAELEIRTKKFFLGSSSSFVCGSNGNIEISASNFHLDQTGSVVMQGTITAEAGGTIGGFDIGSDNLTATNFILNTTDKKLSLGSSNDIFVADADDGIHLGHANFASAPFSVDTKGNLKANAGSIGGFGIGSTEISSSTNNLRLKSGGEITGSKVLFTGGKIGGWEINTGHLQSGNNEIRLDPDSNYVISSSQFQVNPVGAITASSAYISGSTIDLLTDKFTLGNSANLISGSSGNILISGSNIDVLTHKFFFGNPKTFISGSAGNIKISGSNIDVLTDKFFFGNNTTFISGSGGGIKISGSNIDVLTDTFFFGNGTTFISGSAGGIKISGSNIDMSTNTFYLGSPTQYVSGSQGNIEISSSGFHLDHEGNVTMQGTITATEGSVGGASIGADALAFKPYWAISASTSVLPGSFISSSNFKVSSGGNVTASNMLLQGGRIDASPYWRIDRETDVGIEGGFISSSKFKVTAGGNLTASNALLEGGTIGGWTINDTSITADKIIIASDSTPNIKIGKDSHSDTEDLVNMFYDSAASWGLKGRSGNVEVFHLGSKNELAGWSFDNEKLVGGNMIIRKDGTIESDGFASNLPGSGFRLTAASGGFLEVENARIRGTLSTAVFEKESVNAVGGQLYVANSTTLTSSAENPSGRYADTDTTMSVVNVSGFSVGEILSAKKVTGTGFTTEYLYINSASRNAPSSDVDFSGKIYVSRSYGSATSAGASASLGGTPSSAQHYTGSQVIVSTGKLNTGYIRLNANPNDLSTPYMDMVERTGTDIYDLELKARVGDLSGVTDNSFSDGVTGHGIYTSNGYFKGKIEVAGGDFAARARKDYRIAYINSGSLNARIGDHEEYAMGEFLSASLGYVGGNFDNNHYTYSQSKNNPAQYRNITGSGGTWFSVVTGSDKPKDIIEISGSGYDLFVAAAGGYGVSGGNLGQLLLNLFDEGHSILTQGNNTDVINRTGSAGTEWPIKQIAFDAVNYNEAWSRGSHTGSVATGSFSPLAVTDPILQGWLSPGHWLTVESYEAEDSNPITLLGTMDGSKPGGSSFTPLAQRNPSFSHNGGGASGSADGPPHSQSRAGAHYLAFYGTNPRGGRWVHCQAPVRLDKLYEQNPTAANRIIDFLLKKDVAQESYQQGITTITGDMISTGKTVSTNWPHAGSEINLNAGTIKLGGEDDPLFEVDASGHVSASAGSIAGLQITTTSLRRPGFYEISSSQDPDDPVSFISSSAFKVSAGGNVTASNLLLAGGRLDASPYWQIERKTGTEPGGFISSSNFKVSPSGNVTASNISIGGGLIDASPYWKIDRKTGTEPGGFISSSNFKVSPSGNVTGSNVKFTGGTIAGWTINDTSLDGGAMHVNKGGFISSSNNWQISSSAILSDPTGFISSSAFKVSVGGNVTASNISIGGGVIDASPYWKIDRKTGTETAGFISSSAFKVSPAGAISASSGDIAGWGIGNGELVGGNVLLNKSGKVTIGTSNDVAILDATDGTYRIWAGNATAASAPFSVTKTGVLTATGATISGDVTITNPGDFAPVNATVSGKSLHLDLMLTQSGHYSGSNQEVGPAGVAGVYALNTTGSALMSTEFGTPGFPGVLTTVWGVVTRDHDSDLFSKFGGPNIQYHNGNDIAFGTEPYICVKNPGHSAHGTVNDNVSIPELGIGAGGPSTGGYGAYGNWAHKIFMKGALHRGEGWTATFDIETTTTWATCMFGLGDETTPPYAVGEKYWQAMGDSRGAGGRSGLDYSIYMSSHKANSASAGISTMYRDDEGVQRHHPKNWGGSGGTYNDNHTAGSVPAFCLANIEARGGPNTNTAINGSPGPGGIYSDESGSFGLYSFASMYADGKLAGKRRNEAAVFGDNPNVYGDTYHVLSDRHYSATDNTTGEYFPKRNVWRFVFTVHSGSGCTITAYSNGDYTTPFMSFHTNQGKRKYLTPCFIPYRPAYGAQSNHTHPYYKILGVSVGQGPPSPGTRIAGDLLQSGKIRSNNWTTDRGTEIDLNNEKITFGGTDVGAAAGGTAGLIIDGDASNLKFFKAGSSDYVMRIDDDLLGTHPGIEIPAGTLRIVNTLDFGEAGSGAPMFVASHNAPLGSNRCAAYFGITGQHTLPHKWGVTGVNGRMKKWETNANSCPTHQFTATKPFHAGVVAESSIGFCPANQLDSDRTIIAAFVAFGETSDSNFGYSFYGEDGIMHNNQEIRSNADIIAYHSSDMRMKDNIFRIEDPIDKIKRLRGVEFDWNENAPEWAKEGFGIDSKHDIGVVAQEVQKVVPSAVSTRVDGFLGVKYERLIPLLIEGIKEQQGVIEKLEMRIKKLENDVDS